MMLSIPNQSHVPQSNICKEDFLLKKIFVCIPNFNGSSYLSKLKKIDGVDIVVLDNASTDDSVRICKEKGFIVKEFKNNVDRTHNWLRCLEFFKSSDYDWMKWLFIGDKLSDDCAELMRNAIENDTNSSAVVFNYKIDNGQKCVQWKEDLKDDIIFDKALKKELFAGNNLFGSPIGWMFSRKSLENLPLANLHNFIWAADLYMIMEIIKGGNVKFVNKNIGVFNALERKHYQELSCSLTSILEEIEIIRLISTCYRFSNSVKIQNNEVLIEYFFKALKKFSLKSLTKVLFHHFLKKFTRLIG